MCILFLIIFLFGVVCFFLIYIRTGYLLRGIFMTWWPTHPPSKGFALTHSSLSNEMLVVLVLVGPSGACTNRRTQRTAYYRQNYIHIYSYRRSHRARFFSPTCIALQWNRSQDICWSKVQIGNPRRSSLIHLRARPIGRLSRSLLYSQELGHLGVSHAPHSHGCFIFGQSGTRGVACTY